jgi:mRNA-degrading endonuclease RelE of RelBE toxin-antitoxin system
VNEPTSQPRLAILWSPEARADLRGIDRDVAIQILHCVDRYLLTRAGDVKKLKPPLTGFRLRCGDYRVFFDLQPSSGVNIIAVKNRREAYR